MLISSFYCARNFRPFSDLGISVEGFYICVVTSIVGNAGLLLRSALHIANAQEIPSLGYTGMRLFCFYYQ